MECRRILCSSVFVAVGVALIVGLGAESSARQAPRVPPPSSGLPGKDVRFVPSPDRAVAKMLDMAKVTSTDVVMDLGSGDGRTVIAAARRGARGIGVELTPSLVAFSRQAAIDAGVADLTEFIEGDLFDADLSRATVVTLFLLDEINLQLRPRLLRLKPGTRILTNTFTMGDWVADDIAAVGDCVVWCTPMMWVVPADASGRWTFDGGALTVRQEFQMVSGTLTTPNGSAPMANGRLRGEDLTFSAGGRAYAVRVRANVMEGLVTAVGASTSWHAERSGR